jgi:type I restriction enzyme, S subunit
MKPTTFASLIRDGLLAIGDGYRAKLEELGGDGLIFLRAGLVTEATIEFDNVERFRSELTPQLENKTSRAFDTVVTTKGNSTGRTSFVSGRMPKFVYSPHLSYWRSLDSARLNPRFLRYWSQGREFKHQLTAMMESTDMAPYLSLADQKRLRITLPPIDYQRSIADLLGAMDDKIELNRRVNATLEDTVRVLFRSWFVDFDPVVAKRDGRIPCGMDPETSALFPEHFRDSKLGPIPTGWAMRRLRDIADINARSRSSDFKFQELLYVDISSVSPRHIDRKVRIPTKAAPSRAQRIVRDGDTVWSCVRPNRMSYALVSLASPAVVYEGSSDPSF